MRKAISKKLEVVKIASKKEMNSPICNFSRFTELSHAVKKSMEVSRMVQNA